MASLPPWVILTLPEPCTPTELVARARALSVSADETRDGIALPGGFLARIVDEPFPARLHDRSLLERELQPGRAQLLVSGGTNDLARDQHAQPADIRAAARARANALVGTDPANTTIESAASRKVRALTRVIVDLAPLATSIVLPRANHLVFDVETFCERAREYLDETGYHFPLFTYLKVRNDGDCPTVETTGMWIFGLPDLGMPLGARSPSDAALVLGSVQRELVAEGIWPEEDSTFDAQGGRVTFHRHGDGVWVRDAMRPETMAETRARIRFGRRRALMAIVGPHTHHHIDASSDGVAIEHFLRPGTNGIAVTNGLAERPQRGATPEKENDHLEVMLTSPQLGPWANGFVRWIVDALGQHDGSRPIGPRDRLVLPQPSGDIAGVILWPAGHVNAQRPGERIVSLWDMIPFTPAELAAFRAAPLAQRDWMDAHAEAGTVPHLLERWTRPTG